MFKRLGFILVVLLVLIVSMELFLPAALSQVVSQALMGLTGSDQVTAQLVKKPAISMLLGNFDTINMSAENARVDKLTFSEMQANIKDAKLDMGKLISQRLIDFQSVGAIDIKAVITQDELARYLNQSVKGVKNAKVEIDTEKITVSSNFLIGGFANVAVSIEGKIITDGQKLKFVVQKFLLNNKFAGNLGGALFTEIPLMELNRLPFHVNVRDINLEQGKVVIYMDNH